DVRDFMRDEEVDVWITADGIGIEPDAGRGQREAERLAAGMLDADHRRAAEEEALGLGLAQRGEDGRERGFESRLGARRHVEPRRARDVFPPVRDALDAGRVGQTATLGARRPVAVIVVSLRHWMVWLPPPTTRPARGDRRDTERPVVAQGDV